MSISATDEVIRTAPDQRVKVRVYRPDQIAARAPIVLHLHGGAFVDGSLDSGRPVARLLAESGAVVVAAEYPLAPAHPFPEALRASYALLVWMNRNRARLSHRASQLYVAGEEAGGNLAASLALIARDRCAPALAGQILLSPMLDPDLATCSIREAEAGPVGCRWADGWQGYLGSAARAAHPYASPMAVSRLSGLAPALVLTAADDPLRDESLSYAARLLGAGIPVEKHVLPAPTGWPEALDSTIDGGDAPWAATLRRRFTAFLAETAAPEREAISFNAIQA